MTKAAIDGIIKDWGDRLFHEPIRGRKGRNIRGGKISASASTAKPNSAATRDKIARTAKRAPEVMVKISGGGKNMKHIEAHIEYISRDGEIGIEDEKGDIHHGLDGVQDVRDAWAKGRVGIPLEGQKRKEAFNIILSMPPGTDRTAVKDAARTFAAKQFVNHQYVFAAHDDEKHPHVHLIVKATGHHGERLNPRKADLQHWREQFAERLREHGIEANATPRKVRGVVRKAEKQAVRNINAEHEKGKREEPAIVTVGQQEREAREANGKTNRKAALDKIRAGRREIEKAYGQIARALATGDNADKALALQIVGLVKHMPPVGPQQQPNAEPMREVVRTQDREPIIRPATIEQGRAHPEDEITR